MPTFTWRADEKIRSDQLDHSCSLVTGLCCHHRPCDAARDINSLIRGHHHELNASVGASGPHGFAVRISALRLRAPLRPSHPALNVRDDAYAPLRVRDSERHSSDFSCEGSEI